MTKKEMERYASEHGVAALLDHLGLSDLGTRVCEMENNMVRHATDASRYKRSSDLWYNKLRTLENRVRNAIVIGEHIDPDKLYNLRTSVPAKPRKTLKEMRKDAMAKSRRIRG